MSEQRLKTSDGKYEFIVRDGEWRVEVLRNGELWLYIEQGHKAIATLISDCLNLRSVLEQFNDCPYMVDSTTVAKGKTPDECADQVVVNRSVAWRKITAMDEALAPYKEVRDETV